MIEKKNLPLIHWIVINNIYPAGAFSLFQYKITKK